VDELFNRFSLEAIKFNSFVLLAMIAAWLVVVCCAVSSIRARPFSARQKLFWVVFVVAVPLVGVLAYLPFSFNREDLPDILLGKGHSKHSKRSSSSPRQLPNVKR
jgi:hypothetical protein